MQFLVNCVAAKSWLVLPAIATIDVWDLPPARARPLQHFYNFLNCRCIRNALNRFD
jgi:hypothetical protein